MNLMQLIKGTKQVLPVALDNAKDPKLNIYQINVVDMVGVRVKQITCWISSVSNTNDRYKCWMMFTKVPVNKLNELDKVSTTRTEVRVRCNCLAYYFWCIFANKIHKVLAGGGFHIYKRKTPPPPNGRPHCNENNIPCCCKHLIYMTKQLVDKGIID